MTRRAHGDAEAGPYSRHGDTEPKAQRNIFAEEFGERLRDTRERRGLTQEQLARMIGIAASRESEYESGRFTPHLEKAVKLAEALEVTLDELVGSSPPLQTEDVWDARLRASVRDLEASANPRYIDAARLAIQALASLARTDTLSPRLPKRRERHAHGPAGDGSAGRRGR